MSCTTTRGKATGSVPRFPCGGWTIFCTTRNNPGQPRYLVDYTGTGNTLDAGRPQVLRLVMDSLRYWACEMHVDGFRFDLATTLARQHYDVDMASTFFTLVEQDPVLSRVKLIAEAWDVGAGRVTASAAFPWLWSEWNGRFRDVVRRFWRGDAGLQGVFATRYAGSNDMYRAPERRLSASVNFVTAHDGFTLEDLVSYEHKHNRAKRGEQPRRARAQLQRQLRRGGPHRPAPTC